MDDDTVAYFPPVIAVKVLPKVCRRFHIDEARIFTELPVRVVGDPSFPVIGINHFSARKMRHTFMQNDIVLIFVLINIPRRCD